MRDIHLEVLREKLRQREMSILNEEETGVEDPNKPMNQQQGVAVDKSGEAPKPQGVEDANQFRIVELEKKVKEKEKVIEGLVSKYKLDGDIVSEEEFRKNIAKADSTFLNHENTGVQNIKKGVEQIGDMIKDKKQEE